jgi:predicted nucleic acid-binding protein
VRVLIDTNVIIYAATAGPARDACVALLTAVARGQVEGFISTAVLEEVWHIEHSGRAGPLDGLALRTYRLFTPLLPVTDETVQLALSFDARSLGANDRIHLAVCRLNGIDSIVSADAGFDGITGLRRVDPGDRLTLDRIVGS